MQPAPARQQLRGALQRLAECEAVEGVKGLPCLWRVRPPFAQKYGLSQELPRDLVSIPVTRHDHLPVPTSLLWDSVPVGIWVSQW